MRNLGHQSPAKTAMVGWPNPHVRGVSWIYSRVKVEIDQIFMLEPLDCFPETLMHLVESITFVMFPP